MFTSYPTNGDSLWNPLVYTFETETKSDLEVMVHNITTNKEEWVKKLHNTQSATINLAPIYRYSAMPSPYIRETQIYPAEGGFVKLKATCAGNSTPESIFTLSKNRVQPGDLITTMPLSRLISPLEKDTVRIYTNPNEEVTYALYATHDGEKSCIASGSYNKSHDGLLDIVIEIPSHVNTVGDVLDLLIETQYSGTHAIQYNIATPYQTGESIRLAWLSTAGSIEHHTFPIIKNITHHRDGTNSYTVLSAYSTESYIAAIAEIISSPLVWKLEQDGYKRVSIESDATPIKSFGSLCYVELNVIEPAE